MASKVGRDYSCVVGRLVMGKLIFAFLHPEKHVPSTLDKVWRQMVTCGTVQTWGAMIGVATHKAALSPIGAGWTRSFLSCLKSVPRSRQPLPGNTPGTQARTGRRQAPASPVVVVVSNSASRSWPASGSDIASSPCSPNTGPARFRSSAAGRSGPAGRA